MYVNLLLALKGSIFNQIRKLQFVQSPYQKQENGLEVQLPPPAKLGRTPGQDQLYMVFCLCGIDSSVEVILDPLYCTNPQLLYNIWYEDNQWKTSLWTGSLSTAILHLQFPL